MKESYILYPDVNLSLQSGHVYSSPYFSYLGICVGVNMVREGSVDVGGFF